MATLHLIQVAEKPIICEIIDEMLPANRYYSAILFYCPHDRFQGAAGIKIITVKNIMFTARNEANLYILAII